MKYLILSMVLCFFGTAFLVWGIYQMRTGKMVAKYAKNPADEPKQVGWIFFIIGVVGLWLTLLMGSEYFVPEKDETFQVILNTIGYMVITLMELTMFGSVSYGFKKRRIFGIKNTAKTTKYVKKYYKIVNTALLLCAIFIPILFIFGAALPTLVLFILMMIIVLSMFIIAILMSKIQSKLAKE